MSLKPGWFLQIFVLSILFHGSVAQSDAVPPQMLTVSPADLRGWQETSFAGRTLYRVEDGGQGPALHAIARGTASGLCRKVQVDLNALPILIWHWRLDRAPSRTDERAEEGDDQGLRLGVLHRSAGDSIVAVQYVWSQTERAGALWTNPFVPTALQVAARSGPAQPGRWQAERRDLRADFRAAFGRDVDRVDALCLMTDGDQTGALVEGWYGEVTFQAR
jgi:Protein of unknown function (DUF3047)